MYLAQVAFVLRQKSRVPAESPEPSQPLRLIIVYAVAFRVLLLFSEPIQEVDAYRYVWDGKVAVAGVNPFQFSPHQVLAANWLPWAFLTIAWFWLLLPTQNPWYWIWALPLVPFARSRAWLVLSGLTMIYYLRFWFAYHTPMTAVLGTPYLGNEFFDDVVTGIEFGPWFVWLAICAMSRRARRPLSGSVRSGEFPSEA